MQLHNDKACFSSLLVMGFGRIAEVLYGPYIKNYSNNIYVCEPNEERHAIIKSVIPNAHIIMNLNSLDIYPDKQSIAFNLLPGPYHEETSRELLRAGWNVFTEKPAAISKENWLSLVAQASELGLIVVSAPITPFMLDVQKIKNQLANSSIGNISEVHMTFFAGGPARRGFIDTSRKWFFEKESCVIRDLGPYAVSCLIHIFGKPNNFFWSRNNFRPQIAVKPEGFLIPEFGTAAVGVGIWNNAIITVSLAYRSFVNDVEAKMQVVTDTGSLCANLDDQPVNGAHPSIKISLTIDLIKNSLANLQFWTKHTSEVTDTLELLDLALGLSDASEKRKIVA